MFLILKQTQLCIQYQNDIIISHEYVVKVVSFPYSLRHFQNMVTAGIFLMKNDATTLVCFPYFPQNFGNQMVVFYSELSVMQYFKAFTSHLQQCERFISSIVN